MQLHNGYNISLRSLSSPGHRAFLDQFTIAPVTYIASAICHSLPIYLSIYLSIHSANTDRMNIMCKALGYMYWRKIKPVENTIWCAERNVCYLHVYFLRSCFVALSVSSLAYKSRKGSTYVFCYLFKSLQHLIQEIVWILLTSWQLQVRDKDFKSNIFFHRPGIAWKWVFSSVLLSDSHLLWKNAKII